MGASSLLGSDSSDPSWIKDHKVTRERPVPSFATPNHRRDRQILSIERAQVLTQRPSLAHADPPDEEGQGRGGDFGTQAEACRVPGSREQQQQQQQQR